MCFSPSSAHHNHQSSPAQKIITPIQNLHHRQLSILLLLCREISLTKRLGSSVKSLIARKTNSGDSETADGHVNMGVEGGTLN